MVAIKRIGVLATEDVVSGEKKEKEQGVGGALYKCENHDAFGHSSYAGVYHWIVVPRRGWLSKREHVRGLRLCSNDGASCLIGRRDISTVQWAASNIYAIS